MNEYDTLDDLIEIFDKDTYSYKKYHKQLVDNHKKAFLDQDLPDSLKDDFIISELLAFMCKEIKKLKGEFRGHMRNEHPYA